MIRKYGIPQALYCDHKNACALAREPAEAELLKGITKPESHFLKACEKPGAGVIAAGSPQAKGRVERSHGRDQDRLVKELRLAGISAIEEADRLSGETYLPEMNGKFSRSSANPADAHVPPGTADLADILCFEHERTASSDYVVRFECRLLQILRTGRILPRPGDRVTVRIRLDGSLSIPWKGKALPAEEKKIPKKGQTDSHAA
ncbi:MAG: hypothetical protein LBK13_02645 [Spirochaetales bacterium]|nr:hypothetical protein [Spirochaetales bacterium]